MSKKRLDQELVRRGLVSSRSQAESYIKLGYVRVGNRTISKPGLFVSDADNIKVTAKEQYVSRAALKLASVASVFNFDFKNKTVLDVGSSTGGFTDYALRQGAKRVIAVDVGTGQMHPTLKSDKRVELYEQTDIRNVRPRQTEESSKNEEIKIEKADIVLIDVSFVSLREILPSVSRLVTDKSVVITMVKPQFESGASIKNKGVIKNDKLRREVLKGFEAWVRDLFIIVRKADSEVAGSKGNVERFYMLRKLVTGGN